MKTTLALLALVVTSAFTLAASAQDISGSWQVEKVSDAEPPKGAQLTLAFGDENKATITYTLGSDTQSWNYTYTVADGQLTLEPAKSFGEPTPVVYDIKFDEGKLHLLTPKPKPIEEEAEETAEAEATEGEATEGEAVEENAEAKEAGAAEADADTSTTEEVEEVEEEDSRTPVWVLVKATS